MDTHSTDSMTTTIHPSEMLWEEQLRNPVYAPEMAPVPSPIPGRAFFPGGYGLEGAREGEPLPPFPFGKVMVIGQDFQTEKTYKERFQLGEEPLNDGTWKPLLALFDAARIDHADAFFTNAYLGLRRKEPATGKNPGRRHAPYVNWCKQFLLYQMQVQRPRILLVLGAEPLKVVASMSPDLNDLRRDQPFNQIDTSTCGPVRHGVRFDGIDAWDTCLVSLTHPSYRFINVGRRSFKGRVGHDAELLMLQQAFSAT